MADAKRCDRCGAYYSIEDMIKSIDGIHFYKMALISPTGRFSHDFDLCNNCKLELSDFMLKPGFIKNLKGETHE